MAAQTIHQVASTDTGIRICTYPVFVPGHSLPEESRFFFSYTVEIWNDRPVPVQLIERRWLIINGDGVREEVHGSGVVGKMPVIASGECYVYTSFCPLNTSWGTMEGSYTMREEDGTAFEVPIPRFILAFDRGPARRELPSSDISLPEKMAE